MERYGDKRLVGLRTGTVICLSLLAMPASALEIPSRIQSMICSQQASTTYQLTVKVIDFSGILMKNKPLNGTTKAIEICSEHFDSSLYAGHIVDEALDEINRVRGSALRFIPTRVPHKDPVHLVPGANLNSAMDYVDAYQPQPAACGLAKGPPWSFALRECGGEDHFSVFANSMKFTQFGHPEWWTCPDRAAWLHELGHGFGMKHAPKWRDASTKVYISVMEGNLDRLSALDVAFLRHYYPAKKMKDHRNYVASSLTRFDGKKGTFKEKNPDKFYVDASGKLMDCATHAAPKLYAAWFNTGNIASEKLTCGINAFELRQKNNPAIGIGIKQWKMARMTALSQDQWQGDANTRIDATAIDFSQQWELVFRVNASATLDETTAKDNEVSTPVSLYNETCM